MKLKILSSLLLLCFLVSGGKACEARKLSSIHLFEQKCLVFGKEPITGYNVFHKRLPPPSNNLKFVKQTLPRAIVSLFMHGSADFHIYSPVYEIVIFLQPHTIFLKNVSPVNEKRGPPLD